MKGDIGNRGHMILEFTVHRVDGGVERMMDEVARDESLELHINGVNYRRLTASPTLRRELIYGHLYAHGIAHPEEIEELIIHPPKAHVKLRRSIDVEAIRELELQLLSEAEGVPSRRGHQRGGRKACSPDGGDGEARRRLQENWRSPRRPIGSHHGGDRRLRRGCEQILSRGQGHRPNASQRPEAKRIDAAQHGEAVSPYGFEGCEMRHPPNSLQGRPHLLGD